MGPSAGTYKEMQNQTKNKIKKDQVEAGAAGIGTTVYVGRRGTPGTGGRAGGNGEHRRRGKK